MDYYINPASFSASFMVPSEVVDKYIRLTGAVQLKVLLYVFKNMSSGFDLSKLCEDLRIPEADANDALRFWADTGILMSKEQNKVVTAQKVENTETVVKKSEKPSRTDVAKRGNDDPKIMFLLREAQLKFGRNLKSNESATLVWLYDDEGMDVSLILMIVQYAMSEGRCNISFIEKTAVEWINSGVSSIADAERQMEKMIKIKTTWSIVQSCFGIEKRMPSTKETEFSYLWINDWNFSKEMLKAAYEICVDTKSKFSFPYVSKILENWHNSGYKKPEDIVSKKSSAAKKTKSNYAAYDEELFEKMLNNK